MQTDPTVEHRGSPAEGLFGATLGFFVGFAAVALFGPTAVKFRQVMDLSPVLVGLLVAAPSLSGSLLRIPFSAWVDTNGGRKPFLVLLGMSIAGMLGLLLIVVFLYPDHLGIGVYPLLLLFGVLCGCGIATFSVGISQVSYWYPQAKQGRALGIYAGVGNLAPGVFSFLLPLVLAAWGLSNAYLLWLLFLVAGTALYAMKGRNAWYFSFLKAGYAPPEARQAAQSRGQELFPAGSLTDSLRLSAAVWKTWALVIVYFTTFGGFIALTAWFATYWTGLFGVGGVVAGLLTAMYSVLTSAIRVPGGTISDRIGGEKTAILALTTLLIGALMMTMSQTLAISVVGAIIMALGMGVTNAAVFKLVPQEVPQAVGGAAGWVGGLGAFGGFAIPPLMGAFVDRFGRSGYATGFVVFIALAAVALLLAWLLKRCHPTAPVAVAAVPAPALDPPADPPADGGGIKSSLLGTLILGTAVVFSLGALGARVGSFHLPGNQQGYAPAQPIAFSHRLHGGELQINCLYCHYAAEKSRHAGIPPAGVCMNCHGFVTASLGAVRAEDAAAAEEGRKPRRVVSPELQKLYDALGLDDKLQPAPNKTPKPIEWIKVHNLPDFVYFDHRAHVNAGVSCQKCHGPVETMERVHQVEDLSMGWCVNCHRRVNQTGVAGRTVQASIDCAACHY